MTPRRSVNSTSTGPSSGFGLSLRNASGIGSRVRPVEAAGQLHRCDFFVKVIGRRPFHEQVAGARHDAQAERAIGGRDHVSFVRVEHGGVALDEERIVPLMCLVMDNRAGHRPACAGLDHAATHQDAFRQREIDARGDRVAGHDEVAAQQVLVGPNSRVGRLSARSKRRGRLRSGSVPLCRSWLHHRQDPCRCRVFRTCCPRLDPRPDGRRAILAKRHLAFDDVGAAERERRSCRHPP